MAVEEVRHLCLEKRATVMALLARRKSCCFSLIFFYRGRRRIKNIFSVHLTARYDERSRKKNQNVEAKERPWPWPVAEREI